MNQNTAKYKTWLNKETGNTLNGYFEGIANKKNISGFAMGYQERVDCKGKATYRIHLNWGHATTNAWYTVLSNSNYTFTEFNYPKPGSNSVFNNIKMLHTIQ